MSGRTSSAADTAKLMMLGSAAVGKTSLLQRFCKETFETSYVATIGIDFASKKVERDGRTLNLEVWDTAGQERFDTINHSYYNRAHGMVVTYSVDDRISFEQVTKWIDDIKKHASSVEKVLVANKSDLADEERRVTPEEGAELARELGLQFFETSAKTGSNVNDAFSALAALVFSKRKPSEVPNSAPQLGTPPKEKKSGCPC